MTDRNPVPASTYRLQCHARFTFDDAAAQVPYLAGLGVAQLCCSPILQAAPGSAHCYDVVDHSQIFDESGGEAAFRRLATAAHNHGLGVVVDVVPNHMAVPTPLWHNHALWEVLREGPDSPFAHWFDIDLTGSQAILMPVLGDKIGRLEVGMEADLVVLDLASTPVIEQAAARAEDVWGELFPTIMLGDDRAVAAVWVGGEVA